VFGECDYCGVHYACGHTQGARARRGEEPFARNRAGVSGVESKLRPVEAPGSRECDEHDNDDKTNSRTQNRGPHVGTGHECQDLPTAPRLEISPIRGPPTPHSPSCVVAHASHSWRKGFMREHMHQRVDGCDERSENEAFGNIELLT